MAEVETMLMTSAEREACYRLAYEVFCEEMGTMQAEADHARRLVLDQAIAQAHLIGARVNGELVGTLGILWGGDTHFPVYFEQGFDVTRFLAVVPREHMAINIRFLVKESYRHSQVPFKLLLEATRFQIAQGVTLAFCDCQPHLLPLYTSLGFRPCAPLFDQPGFGLMVPLAVVVIDRQYMQEVHSPLLRYIPQDIADANLAARIHALMPPEPPVQSRERLDEEAWSEVYALLSQSRGRISAFEGFAPQEVEAFLERGQILHCHRGQQVIVQGQGTRTAYVVLDGTVEVRKHGQTVATLAAGELFGEFALLLQSKRTADVFATSDDVRLVALSERTLQRLMASRSELAAKFLFNLSRALALKLAVQEW